LAAAAVMASMYVAGWLACRRPEADARSSFTVEQPSIMVASAIRRTLDRTTGMPRTAWLVFGDGRRLPLSLERPCAETRPALPDSAARLAEELCRATGTVMLLVDGRSPEPASCEAPAESRESEIRVPALPAGSMAVLAGRDVVLVADTQHRPLS